jgi:hypothetical protein
MLRRIRGPKTNDAAEAEESDILRKGGGWVSSCITLLIELLTKKAKIIDA